MVIITRELAVTVLRMGATQAGVVMRREHVRQGQDLPADRRDPRGDRRARHSRCGSSLLLYVTVLVTVLSGLDYFFGLRRRMAAGAGARSRQRLRAAARSGARRASSHCSSVVCRARGRRPSRAPRAARRAGRGARRRRCAGGSSRGSPGAPRRSSRRRAREARATTPAIISRTQSSTKRGRRCAFSTTSTSSERFISS